ncbi:MAG: DUF402 domain-containing protein [Deltaproteobacteria bacterium]|nr:DUF402 domain-containing protein [Deltaproteobacteria bacterium]
MPSPVETPQPTADGDPLPLPLILEIKRTLAGREKRFKCAVLRRDGAHVIVLFVATVAMHVHGVDLPAGTVTFGHFWSDRPYNVYHWLKGDNGATLGYYLNLAADTCVTDDRLEWLDLIVDILVLPKATATAAATVTVLDEDEIPSDASVALRARIDEAKAAALNDLPQIIPQLEDHRVILWPRVQAHRAASLP